METKLELKHLAPYLPYGLKVMRPDGKTILQVEGIANGMYIFTENGLPENTYGSLNGSKPILKPIYDIPNGLLNVFQGRNLDIELDKFTLCWCIEDSEQYYPGGSYEIDFDLWYGNYEKIIENHFDIFGLIEKGLAIDINAI